MTHIDAIALDVPDTAAAERFYADAFGTDLPLRFRVAREPAAGFRGYTLSLLMPQPADADALIDSAVAAGAGVLKPAGTSLWGYGGVVRAPDGAIWQVVTSTKKNRTPVSRRPEGVVLLLGVADVAASKAFYVEHGLVVGTRFGSKYVEFDTGDGPVKLSLYKRRALAKAAGVAPEGSGSHRIAMAGAAEPFADPDGFAWEPAPMAAKS